MRLDRLILTGFGRFSGRTLDLAPGLTIIYGQNESGKSTIQAFIRGMLYGFKKRSARREYAEEAARYRPWSGEEYRGALLYTLDDGSAYRVERLFEPGRDGVRVYDAVTGADLTRSFAMDRRKELRFAEAHLRIPEEVFTATAWVGQLAVGRLEMGRELVQRVANLAESGQEDLSVRAALRVIEEQIREIGTERAPTKPYARISRQIAEKRQELERALRIREQTLEWEAGLREARTAMAALEAELAEAQRRLLWAQLAEAEELHERVRASTAQMQAAAQRARELAPFAFFPADRKGRLEECQAQIAQASGVIERSRRRLEELAGARAALEGRLGEYGGLLALGPDGAAEVAAAARMAGASGSRLPELRQELARLEEMIARIEEAIAPLAAAAGAGEAALAEIERLEQEIGAVRSRLDPAAVDRLRAEAARLERAHRSAGGVGWLAAALLLLLAAAALSLGGLLPLPVAAGVGAAGLLCLLPGLGALRGRARLAADLRAARAELQAAEGALAAESERIGGLERQREQILRSLGVVSVGELRSQLIRYEQLTARRDGHLMRRDAILAEVRRLEGENASQRRRLEAILGDMLGVEGGRTPDGGWSLEELQAAVAQAQAVRLELEAIQREVAELEGRIAAEEERIAAARAERDAILAAAGVDDVAAFEEGCALHEEWRKAEREAEGLRRALSALLGDDDPARLAREVERLRGQVRGGRPADLEDAESLRAEIRRLEGERAAWQARASDLAARVETATAEIADTADLQREIQALQEEKQALDEELAALELARSVISEVSSQIHREFAPRLNRAMGEIVAELTQGRYRTVRIDEDLTIRAIAEGDRTVEITSLSGGTIDQFYLALRVAILDLLTEGQERIPLFLDDPFVQYDDERLRAALAFLARVAGERQVVLMTCHRREVRMGQELGAEIIDL